MRITFFSLIMLFCFATGSNAQVQKTLSNTNDRMAANSTIRGNLLIPSELMQKMQQNWQLSISQIPGNAVKLELWQVVYMPDRKNMNVTNIYLKQQIEARISYQLANGNIQYQIEGVRPSNDLAVVAFCSYIESDP